MEDSPLPEQDELDRVHWQIVQGKRAIRIRQINSIVRNAISSTQKLTILPTISDETVYEHKNPQKDDDNPRKKSSISLPHTLDPSAQDHLKNLRQKETDLLRHALPTRQNQHRHFTIVCLGIDASEFDTLHSTAFLELHRAAFWAKSRKNQDAYLAAQSALLQIRGIRRRVVEEWEVAMREEVDRSEAVLRKEWKRRRRRGLIPKTGFQSRAHSRVSSCTEVDVVTEKMMSPKARKSGDDMKTDLKRHWFCF